MLLTDIKNAFNAISRRAVMKAVKKHMPEMFPWFVVCYGGSRPSDLLFGGRFGRSKETYLEKPHRQKKVASDGLVCVILSCCGKSHRRQEGTVLLFR